MKRQILYKYYLKIKNKNIPPNCVDGRPWKNKKLPSLTPQALGGSLHFFVLFCLKNNLPLSLENLKMTFLQLKQHKIPLGVHIDDHNKTNPKNSGCGFADNLPNILENVICYKEKTEEILYKNDLSKKLKITKKLIKTQIDSLEKKVKVILNEPIIYGKTLFKKLEKESFQITVYELTGNHKEKAALVNLQTEKTFNTIKAASENIQAFNLDLWYVEKICKILEIPRDFTLITSLSLYISTERTLRKEKDPLPLIIF